MLRLRLDPEEEIVLAHPAGQVRLWLEPAPEGRRHLVISFPIPAVGQDLAFVLPGLPLCRVERVVADNGGVNLAFDVPRELDVRRRRRAADTRSPETERTTDGKTA